MKIYAPSAQAICIFRERTTRDAPALHMFPEKSDTFTKSAKQPFPGKAPAFPSRTERTKGGPFFFPSPVCASGNSKAPPKTAGPGGSEPSARRYNTRRSAHAGASRSCRNAGAKRAGRFYPGPKDFKRHIQGGGNGVYAQNARQHRNLNHGLLY